jgi:diguanylate cyclase (GGDEF)-like protein
MLLLLYGLLCVPAYGRLTARLQRARTLQAAREAGLVDAEALIALARELPALGTLPRMARRLTSAVREAFGAQSGALLVADPQTGRLQTLVSRPGQDEGTHELPVLLSAEDPALRMLQRVGRPMSTEELRETSAELDRHLRALEAHLLVPLVHKDQLVGVLVLGPPVRGLFYSDPQRELLGLVAHHVSTVFENARLFASVTYEGLTGLMRREAILECLALEIERADRYQRPLAICMVDIDHFKDVNDRLGHLAGDVVLRRVAAELASGLRTSDRAGRYGGEEFLVVLPETAHDQAAAAAENMRERVESMAVVVGTDQRVSVQVSIGVASFGSIEAEPETWTEELIAAADRALYRAKEMGRNRVESGLVPTRGEPVVSQAVVSIRSAPV